jgi:hypothetical protein
MRDLLRALHRRYLTRGLTREERARLDALPAAHWPTPQEFAADVDHLRTRLAAQLDRKVQARVQGNDLTRARAEISTGLVPATQETVAAALYSPPALPEEDLARIRQGERERRALAELDRMRTERVHYVIDWTREQWLALVRHGIDPTHPLHVDGGLTVVGTVPPAQGNGFRVVDVPRRKRVCELDGVEIDGHEVSDLDPHGGCLYCGKEDIYGDDDYYLDDDPEERALGEAELAEAALEDASVWPSTEGCAR